jgi:catechol 2,3-dioxygenase-like lactoylglutathione lyase family enzyme
MSNDRDPVVMLHHTGYTVSDLERSLHFYRDLLGCDVIATQEKQGGYLAAIVGYPEAHVRMAHLRAPESGHIIELFEYLAPVRERPAEASHLQSCDVGTAHMCFVVRDLNATYGRLLAAGVEFISAPVEIDTGINTGGRSLYLRDPDGIPMELFELPRRA